MKKLILLLLLAGCKKQQTTQQPQPMPTPQPVMKSVKVFLKGQGHQGQAQIQWNYSGTPSAYDTYTFSLNQSMYTKAITSNSIFINAWCYDYTMNDAIVEYSVSVDGVIVNSGSGKNIAIPVKIQ